MAEKQISIQVTGDSLAMPRPEEGIPRVKSYPHILSRKYGYSVKCSANYGNTTKTTFNVESVDYVVIHLGLVDCFPRLFPNKVKNTLRILPNQLRKIIMLPFTLNRYHMTRTFRRTSVDVDVFSRNIKTMIEQLWSWGITPIIVTIMDVDEEVEKRNYGVNDNIEKYNLVLKYYSGLYKCILIDINEISKSVKLIRHTDGQHLSKAGHQTVAFLIDEAIKCDRDQSCQTK